MKAKHFKIYEFVSPEVYKTFGDKAWQFIDPRLIETMDFFRDVFGRPITINDWWWNGKFTQRGLRENICEIVKNKTLKDQLYLSAHLLGMGADWDLEGYDAKFTRMEIVNLSPSLPHPIRIEKNVDWIHTDVMVYKQKRNIYFFNK